MTKNSTKDMSCRSCGAPAELGLSKCTYCKQPVLITAFNSVYDMPMQMVNQYAASYRDALQGEPQASDLNNSIAFCFLKLKKYDEALRAFNKAMETNFDNPETYFYAAICLLGGKKAFLAQKSQISKIEENLNAAIDIETRGIFYYFLAYVKYDYYERRNLKSSPTYQELLSQAQKSGVSEHDIGQLFGVLNVARPEDM